MGFMIGNNYRIKQKRVDRLLEIPNEPIKLWGRLNLYLEIQTEKNKIFQNKQYL